ncbi:MAG: ADOP family duplicated permease [Acidobacteriota bacterium]
MTGRGRLPRLLLRLYPRAYRERFGAEIADAFRAQLRAARRRGVVAFLCTLVRESIGLVRGGIAEQLAARDHDGASLAPLVQDRPRAVQGSEVERAGVRPRAGSLDAWRRDLGHGVRRLWRDPAGSAAVVLTLALGLAVCTSVLTLVDHVLLRPLPYPQPERLVRVWAAEDEGSRFLDATWDEVAALRSGEPVFESLAAFSIAPRDLADDAARPAQVEIARVSPGFFDVLGVEPVTGRSFTAEEEAEGLAVVVLSHGFWRTRYGGGAVLGRSLSIQSQAHEIVGVMAPAFDHPQNVALWRPFTAEENVDDDRELQVIARLAVGVEPARASSAATAALARLRAERGGDDEELTAWVQPLREMLVREVDEILWALLAGVAALLLVAVANVANLQLVRGTVRRRELALRLALGADRGRLVRQLMVESLVLTVCAGAVGLVAGQALLALVLRTVPADLPRVAAVQLDARAAGLVVLLTLAAGFIFGLGAAWRTVARAPLAGLRGGRGGIDRSDLRLQQTLVGAEIGLATVLVLTAMLCFGGVAAQLDVEPGFDAEGLISMGVSPPPSVDDTAPRQDFYEEVARELESVAGVASVALGSSDPVATDGFRMPFELLGAGAPREARAVLRSVGPGYLETVGARLLEGRTPTAADHASAPGVAVVNRAFVEAFFGGSLGASSGDSAVSDESGALGRRIRHPAYFGDELPTEHEIVGVVADWVPEASIEPQPLIFVPYRQLPWPRMRLLVRVDSIRSGGAEALVAGLRARLWSRDSSMALDDTWPVEALIDRRMARPRFQMRLMAGFSQLALALAGVGLYAVLAFQVAQRRRELGVRRALGADARALVVSVLRRGLLIAVPGLVVGLVVSAGVARWLESRLVAVAPFDSGAWFTVVLVMLGTATLAGLVPAGRAARVDPVEELKADG